MIPDMHHSSLDMYWKLPSGVPQDRNTGYLGWTTQRMRQTPLGAFELTGACLTLELFVDLVGHPDPACTNGVSETL